MSKTIEEEWKPIEGYEGLYKVSNLGKIQSLARKTTSGKILKSTLQNGYLKVMLCKNNKKRWYSIHRLVAEAFISNPKNYPIVNHIDGNKLNNNFYNLEWCTAKENISHAIKNKLKVFKRSGEHKLSKKVYQFDLQGNLIKKWDCLNDIQRELGLSKGNISNCCHGRLQKTKGYVWRYENE